MDRNVMAKYLNHLEIRLNNQEGKIETLFKVLQEIVAKELMRGQALHKVLMDKGMFTDADLKAALEGLKAEAEADLKAEAAKVEAEKQAKVEILVPDSVRASSNQDATPTPAVAPVTEVLPNADGQV